MMNEYITYIKESRNFTSLTPRLLERSPLLNNYLALLQNFRAQNVIEYLNKTPRASIAIDWALTTWFTIPTKNFLVHSETLYVHKMDSLPPHQKIPNQGVLLLSDDLLHSTQTSFTLP
ncbi:hypothetical protein PAXRUDRAFT_17449 [Paxillus rubicundulus Ve08.2h10]|uniref:Uncharacterized protein n=1 Tax=Paxillus rubicundulus Ve08.2h10 TaxID=930991 RepID=A0A0D0D1S0_9AGAM|nr:hypothetical protein PAXRUDRAFT_17449 [Paxillus rubicundulus Ve08.2h10]